MHTIRLVAMLSAVAALQPARAQSEIHLIPSGYVGWVAVVFSATNGDAAKFEGDARLYRIPKSGVLLTQAEPNRGVSPAWKFFFEAADGTRTPIQRVRAGPIADTPANRADLAIGVFLAGRGKSTAGGQRSCDVEFDVYFVGTQAQFLAEMSRRFSAVGRVLAGGYVCP